MKDVLNVEPQIESRAVDLGVAKKDLNSPDAADRARDVDGQMTFRAVSSLAAHRPLGSVMHAWLDVCRALSAFSHGENGIIKVDLSEIRTVPS